MEMKPACRYPLELDVEFKKTYAREPSGGTLKNISLTGAFLQNSSRSLSQHDKITLTINLSGRARSIGATVIWKNGRGCGLQFSTVNNQDLQIVDDLIYFLDSKRETRKDVLKSIFKKIS